MTHCIDDWAHRLTTIKILTQNMAKFIKQQAYVTVSAVVTRPALQVRLTTSGHASSSFELLQVIVVMVHLPM